MPIYDYHCKDCGSDFETLVRSMFSNETIFCPECGGQHTSKAISLVAATKGSVPGHAGASAASSASCGPVG
jgi:putative FmdB family regulatory protein